MKKSKLKTILILLIIIVLCLSVGVYAAYALSATEVSYTKPDGTPTSVKSALDELYADNPLASAVSVGDYVAYDATGNYSYTSPKGTYSSHGNGYEDQTFTSFSSVKWRVIGWDGNTGGVMLISEGPVGNFIINDAIGYLYAEQELNNICAIYGHGTGADTSKTFKYQIGDISEGTTEGTITGSGARSINIDDINKICNVIPSAALNGSYGKAYEISGFVTSMKYYDGRYPYPTDRTEVSTVYNYNGSNYLITTKKPYKMLFRDTSDLNNIMYWICGRAIGVHMAGESNYFVRSVKNGAVIYDAAYINYGNSYSSYSNSKGVRPVVFLKSTIQTNGKDSNGAWKIIDN